MKSKKKPDADSSVYNEYLKFLKNRDNNCLFENPDHYLKKFSFEKNMFDNVPCVAYILNYQTHQYLFISEGCKSTFGYTSEEMVKNGPGFQLENLHPDDRVVISGKLFTKFIEYCHSLEAGVHKESRFSMNYRYKRKDNVYIQVLQQYVILETDEVGNPLLNFGICTDITAHKPDNKVVFSISHYNKKKGFKMVSSESFFNKSSIISKRETEIVKHIHKGLSTSKIAEKLNISTSTVKTHRGNIFRKTNCKNSSELINYALAKGII